MNRFQAGAKIKTILSGTLLAQIIPFIVLPLLSRLYLPEEFGYFSLYFVWALTIGNCFAYRYEMSIVIAKTEKRALELSQLCVFNILASCIVLLLIMFLLHFISRLYVPISVDAILSMSIIVSGASIAIANVYMSFKNRCGQYSAMSFVMISQQMLVSIFKVFFGTLCAIAAGLYLGHTAGLVLVGLYCLYSLKHVTKNGIITKLKYIVLAKRYKKFPIFNLPLTILTSFSNGFLITVLFWFEMVVAAGLVGLSRTLINAPVGILTRSIGKVFFELAAKELHEHHSTVEEFVNKTMFMIIRLALLPALFLAFYAENFLIILLGDRWVGVGPYAALLVPVAFMLLLTAWPERIFEVSNKQEVILKYQVFFDSLTVVLLIFISYSIREPLITTAVYSAMAIIYNIGYLYLVYRVGQFRTISFFNILKTTAYLTIMHFLVLLFIGMIFENIMLSIGLSFGYVIVTSLINIKVLKQKSKLSRGGL